MVSGVLSLIAGVAQNGVIGHENRLLWRLKSDMRRFRALTMGKPLVMGRKTFESIGRPLPGRHCIVVSRDPAFEADGVDLAPTIEAALERASEIAGREDGAEIMIGGGGEIYAQTIGLADRLYVTEIALSPAGDAWFPEISPADWRELHRERHAAGPDDEAAFSFVDYVRRT